MEKDKIKKLKKHYWDRHVYKIIEPLLPLKVEVIRTHEIDTQVDYENAIKWVKNGYREDKWWKSRR